MPSNNCSAFLIANQFDSTVGPLCFSKSSSKRKNLFKQPQLCVHTNKPKSNIWVFEFFYLSWSLQNISVQTWSLVQNVYLSNIFQLTVVDPKQGHSLLWLTQSHRCVFSFSPLLKPDWKRQRMQTRCSSNILSVFSIEKRECSFEVRCQDLHTNATYDEEFYLYQHAHVCSLRAACW